MRSVSLLLACALAAACNGEHVYEDGPICPDVDELVAFRAGDVLEIRIVFDDCISACAEEVSATCDVEVEGATITLDARGSWREPGAGACVALCATLTATCMVDGLSAGTYEVRSRDRAVTITLPSAAPPDFDPACPGA